MNIDRPTGLPSVRLSVGRSACLLDSSAPMKSVQRPSTHVTLSDLDNATKDHATNHGRQSESEKTRTQARQSSNDAKTASGRNVFGPIFPSLPTGSLPAWSRGWHLGIRTLRRSVRVTGLPLQERPWRRTQGDGQSPDIRIQISLERRRSHDQSPGCPGDLAAVWIQTGRPVDGKTAPESRPAGRTRKLPTSADDGRSTISGSNLRHGLATP